MIGVNIGFFLSLEAQRVNKNVKKQRKQQRGGRGEERGRGGEGRGGGFVVLSFLTLCCFVCILLLISSSSVFVL